MNDLDLPPRRELPSEVRDRIRTAVHADTTPSRRSRYRAPLAVAAGVAALVAGLVAIRPLTDPGSDLDAGGSASASVGPFTVASGANDEDMGYCTSVAALSPPGGDFAPFVPEPAFTATRLGGDRIIAFRNSGKDGTPGFCELDSETATLSDPLGSSITMADEGDAQVFAFYLSPSGLLGGIAHGMTALEFWVMGTDQNGNPVIRSLPSPVFEDGMFVLQVDELMPGDTVEVLGRDSAGISVVTGRFTYDPATVPPIGATGPFIR